MTFAPSTQVFAVASLFVLAACAGPPRKWGSAPAKSAPVEGTAASTPTPTTTTTTTSAVEKASLPSGCQNAACIEVCERTKEAEACKEAGYALRDGSSNDFVRAAKFFDRACQKKNRYACHELAKATAVGEGVKAEPEKAVTLYTTACEMGVGQACDDLAKIHEKGEMIPRDHTKAIDLLARGCVAEDFQLWTCTALRKAVDKKDKDAQRVVAGWKKACGTKDVIACRGLDRAGMGPKSAKTATK